MADGILPYDAEIEYQSQAQQQQQPQNTPWYGNILDRFTNAFNTGLGYLKSGLGSLTTTIGTGKNAKNGLDYLSGLGGIAFDWWKTRQALGLAKEDNTLQKNALISNLTNNAATGIANSGQVVTMARAFNEDYGNQLAQNYGNMAQTLTNAVGAAGGDTSGLQTQTNNLRNGLQKYSALA